MRTRTKTDLPEFLYKFHPGEVTDSADIPYGRHLLTVDNQRLRRIRKALRCLVNSESSANREIASRRLRCELKWITFGIDGGSYKGAHSGNSLIEKFTNVRDYIELELAGVTLSNARGNPRRDLSMPTPP